MVVGWSPTRDAHVIAGHTYVIWTADDHYAKMRVLQFNTNGTVSLKWGYQVDQGNLQLKPVQYERPEHDEDYPATDKRMILLR